MADKWPVDGFVSLIPNPLRGEPGWLLDHVRGIFGLKFEPQGLPCLVNGDDIAFRIPRPRPDDPNSC